MIGHWRAHGHGSPVTVVAPGLGSTDGEARLPASGVAGTRVVVTFGSHGDAPDAPARYWDYGVLADEVRAAADATGATQAIGVSMGAGALVRLAAEEPGRFTRIALVQPTALDGRRGGDAIRAMSSLAAAVEARDTELLRELIEDGMPSCCGEVGAYVSRRADALLRLPDALRALPATWPVASTAALAAVTAEVLVLSGVGDPLHPEMIAAATASAFPRGELHVLGSTSPLLTHRREVRALLSGFLGATASATASAAAAGSGPAADETPGLRVVPDAAPRAGAGAGGSPTPASRHDWSARRRA